MQNRVLRQMMLRVKVEVVVVDVVVQMVIDDVLDVVPVQLVRVGHVVHHVVSMIMHVHFVALEGNVTALVSWKVGNEGVRMREVEV